MLLSTSGGKMDLGNSGDVFVFDGSSILGDHDLELIVDNPFGGESAAFEVPPLPLVPPAVFELPAGTPGGFCYSSNTSNTSESDGGATSASSSGGNSSAGGSEDDAPRRRKNLKRQVADLELPAEGMEPTLPKAVELELDSLEVFDDYVSRLKKSRALNSEESKAITKQRKRIHNRLYAIQKRAKNKDKQDREMTLVQSLQQQNLALQDEVRRLREENAHLRSALETRFPTQAKRGGMALFAVMVTFAVTLGPSWLNPFGQGNVEYGTGRSLMGVVESGGTWASLAIRVALLVAAITFAMYGFQRTRWILPYFLTPSRKKNA